MVFEKYEVAIKHEALPDPNIKRAICNSFFYQNVYYFRVKHGEKNYVPEQFIDEFFDLVIWGHEHECLIDPQQNPVKNFHVIQPGSPVATSLCEAESKPKYASCKFYLRPIFACEIGSVVSECFFL